MPQPVFLPDKQKLILGSLLALGLITLVNILVGVFRQTKQPASSISQNLTKTARLSLQTKKSPASANNNLTVDVILDPNGAEVDAVDATLLFDTNQLEATKIQTGSLFTSYPVQKISSGKVQLSAFSLPLGSAPAFKPITKAGRLATITFRPKIAQGKASIGFDPSSTLVIGRGQSVLQMAKGVLVKL